MKLIKLKFCSIQCVTACSVHQYAEEKHLDFIQPEWTRTLISIIGNAGVYLNISLPKQLMSKKYWSECSQLVNTKLVVKYFVSLNQKGTLPYQMPLILNRSCCDACEKKCVKGWKSQMIQYMVLKNNSKVLQKTEELGSYDKGFRCLTLLKKIVISNFWYVNSFIKRQKNT